jgi:hypothetical protein
VYNAFINYRCQILDGKFAHYPHNVRYVHTKKKHEFGGFQYYVHKYFKEFGADPNQYYFQRHVNIMSAKEASEIV